jgi:cytochrome P450
MDPPDADRIAYPLLVMVICELLGVPAEDRDRSTSRETWRQAQVPDAGGSDRRWLPAPAPPPTGRSGKTCRAVAEGEPPEPVDLDRRTR